MFGYMMPPQKPTVRQRILRALEAGPATQLDLQKALYPNGWTLAESTGVLEALRWLREAPAQIEELVDEDLGTLKTIKYGLKKMLISAAPSRSRP